jgi:DNA-binding response OmpR family regulator
MSQILIIEPDRILADIYRTTLENNGHEVLMCASAQSAIFAADAINPDLVIMELQLINHSGIEFLYEFRSYPEWQNTPVMILSSVPTAEFVDSKQLLSEELGVVDYYYKPKTSLKDLLAATNKVLKVKA